MKKMMKITAVIAAFFSMVTLTSCLDGENGTNYDLYDYVTVVSGGYGDTYLKGDMTDLTLYPVSSSVLEPLRLNSGEYYKRAYVGVKLAEAYSTSKDKYNISEIAVLQAIPYKSFNERVDTLVGNSKLNSFGSSIWAKSGFVNVDFSVNVKASETANFYNDIHMYITKASQDTLYTKLRYVKDNVGGQNYSVFVSFQLPKYSSEYANIHPKNDSIVVKVEAESELKGELSAYTKCRYSEIY